MSATAPGSSPANTTPASWARRGERGSLLALRFMAWVATTLGRPAARLLLLPITAYFLVFGREARRHSARYLGRALGRAPTLGDQWRHFHTFAGTVLDRVWFARGDTAPFDLTMRGDAGCDDTLKDCIAGRGGFLLGAHLGSFESLHAAGKSFPGMQVTMVMYPDNARKIQGVLQALAPQLKMAIIGIGQPGSTLAIRDALDAGHLVGLLGDRVLAGDARGPKNEPAWLPFLGVPAPFADGPLRLAMLLRRRVIFMVGLFLGGRRYDVRFETMADFREPPADPAAREALIQQSLQAYVARLEALCREAPYNWFNFHDFWHEDETPAR
jgi:predicted LPLAT superfamily acyltransferase